MEPEVGNVHYVINDRSEVRQSLGTPGVEDPVLPIPNDEHELRCIVNCKG
jgi:hypothetical protein